MSEDFRLAVCDDLIANGAPENTAFFPGLYTLAKETATKFRIHQQSVVNYWTQLCMEGNVQPKIGQRLPRRTKLCDQALALIEFYIEEQPSITVKEIKFKLEENGVIGQDEVHITTIYRAVRNRLSSKQTHKKLSANNDRRFTDANMAYTQAYMNELYARDPYRLNFFDEAGFVPTSNHPTRSRIQ